MNEPAIRLEEQIISLFPDRETFVCQGWILKKEKRYLFVYPLYYKSSEENIPEKIRKCERIARRCGLECVFRIVEQTNYYLSALLTDNGYTLQKCGVVCEKSLVRDEEDDDCLGRERTKAGEDRSDGFCQAIRTREGELILKQASRMGEEELSLKRASRTGEGKLFLKPEDGSAAAGYLVTKDDSVVGIRAQEFLFLWRAALRRRLPLEDILWFSNKNGITRILADLPVGDNLPEKYESAGFRKVYDYCIYQKSENVRSESVS